MNEHRYRAGKLTARRFPRSRSVRKVVFFALAAWFFSAGIGTASAETAQLDRDAAPAAPTPSADPALVIGEYELAEGGVIDGDTLRVVGIRRPLRLLMLDTEEVLHGDDLDAPLQKLMRTDFEAYLQQVRAGTTMPTKYATPLGEAAREYAIEFFKGARRVRLEKDRPSDSVGNYGRTLCYVWALYDDGRPPRLYNLEAVRAGMSPYFIKYGRSKRFDALFREAERYAQTHKLGIFSPDRKHYPDYPRRLAWWARRAAALDQLEALRARGLDVIALTGKEAIRTLLKRVGKPVLVWGIVDEHKPDAVRLHDRGATLMLGGDYAIEIEIEGKELAQRLEVEDLHGEALFVSGVLKRDGNLLPKKFQPRRGKHNRRYMRITVRDASQLQRADQPFSLGSSGKSEAKGEQGEAAGKRSER